MKTYEYKGYDANGRAVRGLLEALSAKEARAKLRHMGIWAERVFPTGQPLRFDPGARAYFYRELAALLAAGLPILKAFDVLLDLPDLGPVRSLLAGVRDRVREGISLAAALTQASHSVSPLERAVVEAGERSGTVETMLQNLADHLEERERVRERIYGTLLYPSLVVAVGSIVAAVMLGVLLPRTRALLETTSVPLPPLTAGMLRMGRWTVLAAPWAAAFFFAAVLALRRSLHRDRGAIWWDRWLFQCPVVGRTRMLLVNQRFAHTLALLLRSGVSPVEAVEMAGRATGSRWIARLAGEAAEAVRHGASLSDAVSGIPPLAESLPGRIRIGEATGGVPDLLIHAAARYQEAWEQYVRRTLTLLEPALILGIGAFVLLVTLAVLLPILSLTRTLAG